MNSKYIYTDGIDSVSLISYYQNLRQKVVLIVGYLRNSVRSFDGIDNKLFNYYNLDDCNVDNVSVDDICKTLNDRISYLNNTVIPAIDIKIRNIKAEASSI